MSSNYMYKMSVCLQRRAVNAETNVNRLKEEVTSLQVTLIIDD